MEQIPSVRSAAIGVWVKTGSRNEGPELNGISHFLEHMFFKGTKTRSARDIAEAFDRIGGQVNAFTSKEYTCYYAKVLDNHADHALEVLADMFFNSAFDSEELEKEKNVVYEEIKMYEDAPDDIVHDLLSQAIYGKHPLGYPILGTEDTLSTFSRDTLQQYVHDMYTPEKVVISIAGHVDEALIKQVEKYFGSFTRGQEQNGMVKPIFHQNTLIRKKETEQAHLCLGFDGLKIGDENMYHLTVLNNILGGSMSSRLFQEVREERGLAYSIYSYHSSYQDSGILTIYGGTGANQLDSLYETITQTLDLFKRDGVTEKEVTNTKEQLKGSLMLGLESTNSRMSRNGKNELMLGKHLSLDDIIANIDAVTVERVYELINSIFTNHSIALVSPLASWEH